MDITKHTKLKVNQLLILTLVVVLGITATSTLYFILSNKEKETQLLNFKLTSKEIINDLEKGIQSNFEVLTSIKALYTVTDSVSRKQFKIFNSNILNKNKSIQALSWVPKVNFIEKDFFEQIARNDGLHNFLIKEKIDEEMFPVTKRESYYPVYYIEPLAENEAAIGFDLASNTTRLSALKKAIETNHLTATSRITLAQEKGTQKAILVFCPLKKQGKLIGLFTGVYRIKDLILQSIDNLPAKNCHIAIYDMSAKKGNQLLAQFSKNEDPHLPTETVPSISDGISYKQTIMAADREWLILCTPTQTYLKTFSKSLKLVIIICFILTFGIFYYLYQNFRTINKQKLNAVMLELKVKVRTLELEKSIKKVSDYKTALDAASIVAITNTKGDIEYVNNKFCEVSKYSRKELIGKNQRIVNSNYHPIGFWKEMWKAIVKGQVWNGKIRNQTKTGEFYWVNTTIVPFLDKNNKPYQFLSIRQDITQQKKIEQNIINSIIFSQEQEREYVAEDLHEGLAQNLTGLNFHIQFIESITKELQNEDLKESISLIKKYINQSIESTRSLAMDLMPRSMMKGGLIPSITNYINEKCTDVDIEFRHNLKVNKTKKGVEITIYRSIVYMLEKVVSSPELKNVILQLDDSPTVQVRIEVWGNTNLFSKENKGILLNIQKRAELHGGQLIIHKEENNQTIIELKFES